MIRQETRKERKKERTDGNILVKEEDQVVKTAGLEITSPSIQRKTSVSQNNLKADSYNTLFSSFITTRTTLILVAETDILGATTLWHFILILFPLFISNEILRARSRRPKFPELISNTTTVFHTVLIFGLGWTIPSCFASLHNTIGSYFIFTSIIRVFQAFSDGLYFAQTRNSVSFFYQSLFQTLPVIVWIIAMLMQDPSVGYIIYSIGVLIDLCSHLFRQQFEIVTFKHLKNTILMIFSFSNYYFFEKRILGTKFELDLSVNFDISNFIYAILAISMNYVLFQLYTFSIIKIENCDRKVLVKFLSFITLGSYLFFIGSVQITLANIFSPLRYMANYPIDLSIPINLNAKGAGATGIEYLSTLGPGFPLQGSKMYIFAMLISLGVFGLSISLTSLVISNLKNQKRDIIFLLIIPLISAIAIGGVLIPISWAEQQLNVVFIIMASLFILAFPTIL